jgi:hypothetical protein
MTWPWHGRCPARLTPDAGPLTEEILKEAEYFATNASRMNYPRFRAMGLFVGSGVIEAAFSSKVSRRRPISFSVRGFLQQAEDILDIAASGDSSLQDVAIVLDRQRGMRMLDPSGWSLPALAAEYGATAVFKVEKHGASVRVEGWDGFERCLLQRHLASARLQHLPGMGAVAHAMMLLPPRPVTA